MNSFDSYSSEYFTGVGLEGEMLKVLFHITNEHLIKRGFTAVRWTNSDRTIYTKTGVGSRIEVHVVPSKRLVIVLDSWSDRNFGARTVFENYASRSRLAQLLSFLNSTD